MALPKDLTLRIIAELQTLAEQLGGVDDLEERGSRAKADLDSMSKSLQQTRSELSDAQAQLTQSQRTAQKQFEQDMFDKQGQLRSLTQRVNALETQSRQLTDEVTVKESQLKAASLAMEDMKRKLAS